MTQTLVQNILIFLLKGGMDFLWLLDQKITFSFKPPKFTSKYLLKYVSVFALLLVDSFFVGSLFVASPAYTTILETAFLPNYRSVSFDPNVLGASTSVVLPISQSDSPPPSITAKSVLVWDKLNRKILFEQNAGQRYAPASTTKLMTSLIALELYSLDEKLEVSGECTLVDSTKAYLPAEQEFTAEGLLYGMLVGSAGDAACVLSSTKLEYAEFIQKMNEKAGALGLDNTNFTNPVGLDDANGSHYSTAHDLLKLSLVSMEDPFISTAVRTQIYTLTSVDASYSMDLFSTNHLLWRMPNTTGIKTGTTEKAGEVLLYSYEDWEKELVIVLMGSEDRFEETLQLLEWLFSKYTWSSERAHIVP
jgi:D-alanyl-D-alanine carboxypeptidase